MSAVFRGTYHRLGSFDATGALSPAAGTVEITPLGGSTVTATLDAAGAYQTTLTAVTGPVKVTIVETLTDAPSVRTTYRVVTLGEVVDTSWEFHPTSSVDSIEEIAAALAARQPLDADLTGVAGVSTTSFGRNLLALADGAALADSIPSGTLVQVVGDTMTGELVTPSLAAGATNTKNGRTALRDVSSGTYNTGVGVRALETLTTGGFNTAFGDFAARSLLGGSSNVAVGDRALEVATTATGTVAIGAQALGLSNAADNVAIGRVSQSLNTSGTGNVGVGAQSLQVNQTGINGTAVGIRALASCTVDYNTALGFEAAYRLTTATWCTAVGAQSLAGITTGIYNTAIGGRAMQDNTTGQQNQALGADALQHNTTGSYNTGCAADALQNNTTGSKNTAVGNWSLRQNSSAGENTAVGFAALSGVGDPAPFATTTGTRQVGIGVECGQGSATARNDIVVIGYRAFADGNNAIALGSGASAGAAGAVAIGKDSAGTSASTTTADDFVLGTDLHTVKVAGALTVTGVASHRVGQTTVPAITLYAAEWGLGMDASDTVLFSHNGQGVSLKATASVNGTAQLRATANAVTLTKALISTTAAGSLVLKDTAGTPHYWRVTVSTGGVLTTADLGTTQPTS